MLPIHQAPSGWTGYLDGVAWKRAVHERYGTKLLETRSHMEHDGVLELCLEAMLIAEGVVLVERPAEELLEELRQEGSLRHVTKPIADFLRLFKQSDLDLDGLRARASATSDASRFELFVSLFEPVLQAYEARLAEDGEIDFSDMIKRAVGHVEAARYSSPFTHILVDEFQDISPLRARLLRALLARRPDAVLFAVGDDWQAIYRFTGSDLSLTRHFDEVFGPTATTALDTTFRFNDRLGDVASAFILKNPEQIAKTIQSRVHGLEPSVSLVPVADAAIGLDLALAAVERRAADMGLGDPSALVLARYHSVLEELMRSWPVRHLKARFPRLDVRFATAHAAKGLEADFVVIAGLEQGGSGFPAEKTQEPLLELLLPGYEPYPFAEERRLFYVALTRARHRAYVLYPPASASPFIRELTERDETGQLVYDVWVDEFDGAVGAAKALPSVACPECGGHLVPRTGEFGPFVGCDRYPYCRHHEPPCPNCGGLMRWDRERRVCADPACGETTPVCRRCGGAMVRRSSRYGEFWGCSNYRTGSRASCEHTIPIARHRPARRR